MSKKNIKKNIKITLKRTRKLKEKKRRKIVEVNKLRQCVNTTTRKTIIILKQMYL